jgi:hypothetical protein
LNTKHATERKEGAPSIQTCKPIALTRRLPLPTLATFALFVFKRSSRLPLSPGSAEVDPAVPCGLFDVASPQPPQSRKGLRDPPQNQGQIKLLESVAAIDG